MKMPYKLLPLLTLREKVEKLKKLNASLNKRNVQRTNSGGIYVCIQLFQLYINTTFCPSLRRAKGVGKTLQLFSKVEKIIAILAILAFFAYD